MGDDIGKVGLMKKSMYGTRDAASNWERDWQGHVSCGDFNWDSARRIVSPQEDRVSGLTHRDDFVLTGTTGKLKEVERKMTRVYPITAKVISYGVVKEHQHIEQEVAWREREIVYQHYPRHVGCICEGSRT